MRFGLPSTWTKSTQKPASITCRPASSVDATVPPSRANQWSTTLFLRSSRCSSPSSDAIGLVCEDLDRVVNLRSHSELFSKDSPQSRVPAAHRIHTIFWMVCVVPRVPHRPPAPAPATRTRSESRTTEDQRDPPSGTRALGGDVESDGTAPSALRLSFAYESPAEAGGAATPSTNVTKSRSGRSEWSTLQYFSRESWIARSILGRAPAATPSRTKVRRICL